MAALSGALIMKWWEQGRITPQQSYVHLGLSHGMLPTLSLHSALMMEDLLIVQIECRCIISTRLS